MGAADNLKRYHFSKFSFFADASNDEIAALLQIRTIHHFNEGQSVSFSVQGREGFFYLHEGYAKVVYQRAGDSQTVRIAGPNDLVGFARWYCHKGTYGMVTLSDVTASFFEKEEFLKVQNTSPYLTGEVTHWLMTVLTSQEERLFSLKNSTAHVRVAGTLNELRCRFGRSIGGNNSVLAAPIDRKTLADLCGVANEVLSRTLSEFEKNNIIRRDGRVIVIVNTEALEKMAAS